MDLAGKLETMGLPDVLQMLSQTQRTGTLEVTDGARQKYVYFSGGEVVSAGSSNPVEQLGHFLVSHGLIDEKQLAQAVQAQESSHRLLGEILVEHGAISREQLHHMLRLKAEECIFELFAWERGDFVFQNHRLPEHDLIPIPLQVQELLMEGMQRLDEWQTMRVHIPSAQAVPVSVVADLAAAADDERDGEILRQVDDQLSVEEICLRTHSSEYHVCRALCRAVSQRSLKIVHPRALRGASRVPRGDQTPVSAGALLELGRRLIAEGDLVHAYRHLRAAHSLEPGAAALTAAIRVEEERIRELVRESGVEPRGIPSLTTDIRTLSELELSPADGFVLSRINGSSDVTSILKVSPIPELEALLVFWRMFRDGHLELALPPDTAADELNDS